MKKIFTLIDRLEETIIVILLGLMTLITFGQIIARYFNVSWGSALELTQILFAWLILFGMSYGIKHSLHLGVDTLIKQFPSKIFKLFALMGAALCILYGLMLLSADIAGFSGKGGAIAYWHTIYQLNIGMSDINLPAWIFGEDQRLPRWVAYLILPVGLFLFIVRSAQAFIAIACGRRDTIIASHEAEELLEKAKNEKQ